MANNLYQNVTNQILPASLEAGAAPWVKPWSAPLRPGNNIPHNAATNRPYSGCNVIACFGCRKGRFTSPRFMTFKQALDLGGNVKKVNTVSRSIL